MGRWVSQLWIFVFLGKSSQNSPKPVLICCSSIPCVFCLYIAKRCWLLWFECSVYVSEWMMDFNNKSLDGGGWVGGWVGWALSKYFLNLFNFVKLIAANMLINNEKCSWSDWWLTLVTHNMMTLTLVTLMTLTSPIAYSLSVTSKMTAVAPFCMACFVYKTWHVTIYCQIRGYSQTTLKAMCISVWGVKNALPKNIKELYTFKIKVKAYLLIILLQCLKLLISLVIMLYDISILNFIGIIWLLLFWR